MSGPDEHYDDALANDDFNLDQEELDGLDLEDQLDVLLGEG